MKQNYALTIIMCGFFQHANGIQRLPLPPKEENCSYDDIVKIAKGELCWKLCNHYRDNMQTMTQQDEVQVNYLKNFGKWAVNKNDFDSRQIQDLVHVTAEVDGRSRYTINERYYKL